MILTALALAADPPDAQERAARWLEGYSQKTERGVPIGRDFADPPTLVWQVDLPGPPLNSATHTERGAPVVHGDEILVGSAAGQGLYRVSRIDGAINGVYGANASVESAPVVVDDRVYFADTSGSTFCYSLAGEQLWMHRGNAPILTPPAIADGRVFVTNVDDLVVAIDAAGGDQLWRYKAKRDLTRVAELALYAAPSPLVAGDEVVVGFSSGQLAGLAAEGGEVRWTVDVGEGRYPDIVATPVLSGSDLVVSGYFKPLLAIDRETRNVRWRAESGAAFPALVRDGTIYQPGSDGVLRAFSALTGAERWSWSSGTTAALTRPLWTDAGLLIAASAGSIYLVDPESGEATWSWSEPSLLEGITATPAIEGSQLLFVSNAGVLYSFVVPERRQRDRPSNRRLFRGAR